MAFAVTNARRIDRSDAVPRNIRSDARIAMILIQPDGTVSCATGAADKDALVKAYQYDDLLLMAWAGKWKTETFQLDREDLDLIYKS